MVVVVAVVVVVVVVLLVVVVTVIVVVVVGAVALLKRIYSIETDVNFILKVIAKTVNREVSHWGQI